MRMSLTALAAGAALVLVGQVAEAQSLRRHRAVEPLPPVSGTLRVSPDQFGPGGYRHPHARFARVDTVRVVRGGLYPSEQDYRAVVPAERWATGGTGLSGLIGNTGNPYAGATGWGTADSATTGALLPRAAWQRRGLFTAEPSLADRYGEAPIYAGGYGGGYGDGGGYAPVAYGATPQLPFYGSGTPYSLSYYSSGSSAGPYGSPGGLGTYRSGSYGYGPRLVETGAGYGGGWRQGCTCGPRILHLRRRARHFSER